jgi:hypothetical protein
VPPDRAPEDVRAVERGALASSLEAAGGMDRATNRMDAFLAASLRWGIPRERYVK